MSSKIEISQDKPSHEYKSLYKDESYDKESNIESINEIKKYVLKEGLSEKAEPVKPIKFDEAMLKKLKKKILY